MEVGQISLSQVLHASAKQQAHKQLNENKHYKITEDINKTKQITHTDPPRECQRGAGINNAGDTGGFTNWVLDPSKGVPFVGLKSCCFI